MSGVPTVTISSEGEDISMAYPLLSVEVNYLINKIPYAKLTYSDTDGYAGNFSLTQDAAFTPGKSIKINLRYEEDASKDKEIFEGVLVKHQIKCDGKSALLVLELRHASINLTRSRNNTVFTNKSDVEIFRDIGTRYSGILELSTDINSAQHRQVIQSSCSDWDFLLSRSESNGWWLISNINNQLKLIDPANSGSLPESSIILDLNAGSPIYTVDMTIDILNQVDKVSAESWDVDKQQVLNEELSITLNSNFKKLKSSNNYKLYHCGDLNQNELKSWVHSKQIKNDYSLFKGKIKVAGDLNIEFGAIIELKNLGTYFNGKHVVSSVKHIVDKDGFCTEIGIGMPVDSLISMQNINYPSAGGMLPSVKGLHIGVVKGYDEIADNEKNQLLVKVILPLFGKENNEVWARLSSIYAGPEYGVVFRPEIEDEVVLGFFNNDPRYPVILGSMYSAKNKPPIEFNKENDQKTIITKEKVTIFFNDKNKSMDLLTSKESKISLATGGDAPGITVQDKKGNCLLFNDEGLNASSKADVKINSDKAVIIAATKVEVK